MKEGVDEWSPDDIRRYYESGRVTLLTLAGMLGLTGGEVLDILHGPRSGSDNNVKGV